MFLNAEGFGTVKLDVKSKSANGVVRAFCITFLILLILFQVLTHPSINQDFKRESHSVCEVMALNVA